jgi:N-carbamoylputrescine amidase
MSRASTQAEGVRIAVIQARSLGGVADNWHSTCNQIRAAAGDGAQIICTQELFKTDYFCQTQGLEAFQHAEAIPGETTQDLQALAGELGVVLIASLFERVTAGLYYNTAVVIDADGRYLGKYRKQHIPQDPYFEEKFYFTPGDLGYPVWQTRFGTIGVLICWDQWYPEAARLMALAGAEIIFYPTAIGWLADEKADEGAAQHSAWETVQRGHAVANGCYIATANRVGVEGAIEFWGQSFIADPYGHVLQRAPVAEETILYADCDLRALESTRQTWPFLRDRRIDSYANLQHRSLDPAAVCTQLSSD